MNDVVWKKLAIWKIRKQLEQELFGEYLISENCKKCFDLSVIVFVKLYPASIKSVTAEVVKAVSYVRGSQREIVACIDQASKLSEDTKRYWPYPFKIRWLVPSFPAAIALYYILCRFMKTAGNLQVDSKIYVFNDEGPYGEKLCWVQAMAENDMDAPNMLVLRDEEGNELKRTRIYSFSGKARTNTLRPKYS
ncbi:MAG: hypothetical protein QXV09_06740 [Candidatus Bathyarchaeia archaeon]